MAKVQLWGYRCERCSHEWLPRDKDQDPKVCPKCKSPYWNTPRRGQPETVASLSKLRGFLGEPDQCEDAGIVARVGSGEIVQLHKYAWVCKCVATKYAPGDEVQLKPCSPGHREISDKSMRRIAK